MSNHDLTVFLHIPKTGGTTLNQIFRKQYQIFEFFDHDSLEYKVIKLDQLTEEQKKQIKAVAGHYSYGIHEEFSQSFTYFTMLRDPVNRVISLYYFLRDYPGYERLQTMSLEEYVIKEDEAHNGQTVLISGSLENPDLEKAKERLKKFAMVGITEKFNESLFLLQKTFDWKDILYRKENITMNRPSRDEIPTDVINLIKQYNSLDIELYEFAKKLYQEKLHSLSPDEQAQLEKYIQEQSLLS
ncbi:hypothetical protein JOC77_000653 [Peribacillus deserti]|uniref:Sulfotransferase family protein n=1 Tax=Peribacillus deserti TaxID=673318 RepID=A0ABS2QDM0_9BACI|nr:sulfotransferase family 2 domain-containing protein [Peribacillus deserti]MBM7691248.1 hypothetical protein [Peribacillus deserti]